MESGAQLKALLQLQLASDTSALTHLPYILSTLDDQCFVPNQHLAKWTARINSLLHSREAGARWAGLCIAHKSSLVSKTYMVESAAAWLPTVIPMLSRAEPTSVLKAAIRLLTTIFTRAVEMSEFQRQVSLPNVPKFTAAIANIAANNEDAELKTCCLNTLAFLMPIYPNAHRPAFANLNSLALGFLNGSYPRPNPTPVMEAASRLFSILHLTGGKVGAATLWRKALDDTLAFGWDAYAAVRTTFPMEGRSTAVPPQEGVDPSVNIPLNVDRIRCSAVAIRDLLCTLTTRPVAVPVGNLVKYALALLDASTDGQAEGFVDPTTRAMEISVVPSLWKYGCEIVTSLAESIPRTLEPTLSKIYIALAFRLEHPLTPKQRLPILTALKTILSSTRFVDTPILANRIVRAVLPYLVVVLSSASPAEVAMTAAGEDPSKKGKKKAKNYAGDEVFKVTRDIICPTDVDAEVLLSSLEVVKYCIGNPNLSPSQLSLASRILLSIQLTLSHLAPSILSPDPQVFRKVQSAVHTICTEISSTSTISLQKTLPLVVREVIKSGDSELQASLDLLLHPRLPPIVRPIPTTHSLALFRVEESEEEAAQRKALGLEFGDNLAATFQTQASRDGDTVMQDGFSASGKAASTTPATGFVTFGAPQKTTTPLFGTSTPAPERAPISTPPVVPSGPSVWQPKVQEPPVASSSSAPPSAPTPAPQPLSFTVQEDEEEEDEEMPTIDLGSDSEEE